MTTETITVPGSSTNYRGEPTATYGQMKEYVETNFPGATFRLLGGHWVITLDTGIRENEQVEDSWVDTPAHKAYLTDEASHGNELDRWAWKNGHSDESITEIAFAYNKMVEKFWAEHDALIMKVLTKDMGIAERADIVGAFANNSLSDEQREFIQAFYVKNSHHIGTSILERYDKKQEEI